MVGVVFLWLYTETGHSKYIHWRKTTDTNEAISIEFISFRRCLQTKPFQAGLTIFINHISDMLIRETLCLISYKINNDIINRSNNFIGNSRSESQSGCSAMAALHHKSQSRFLSHCSEFQTHWKLKIYTKYPQLVAGTFCWNLCSVGWLFTTILSVRFYKAPLSSVNYKTDHPVD